MNLKEYLTVLDETLNKKLSVLQALKEATVRQSQIAEAEEFDMEAFEGNMDQKDALLEELEDLDDGFDSIFQKICKDLMEHKEIYKNEILRIQDLIRQCTDSGVEIRSQEERNRQRLETVFSREQKELRQVKTNSKAVSNYYNTMKSLNNNESYFMDQKK